MLTILAQFGPVLVQGGAVVTRPLDPSFRFPVYTFPQRIGGSRLGLDRSVVGVSMRVFLRMSTVQSLATSGRTGKRGPLTVRVDSSHNVSAHT